jgi:hypothetical protein
MISSNTSIVINENALVQKVGEEMVILDAESGQYYALNEMATEMLGQLQEGKTVQATVDHICAEYEASESEVLSDITGMITTLLEKKLASLP